MVASYHLFLFAVALCSACQRSTALEQIQNYGQIPGIGDRDRASEGMKKLFDYGPAARDGSSMPGLGERMMAKKGDQRLVLTVPGFAPIDFNLSTDFSQVHNIDFCFHRYSFTRAADHSLYYAFYLPSIKLRQVAQQFVGSTSLTHGMGCVDDAACVEEQVCNMNI